MDKHYELQSHKNGFSIWLANEKRQCWILDASTILDDGEVEINTKYFNVYRNDDSKSIRLKIKGWKNA